MPVFKEIKVNARVTWLGRVMDQDSDLRSTAVTEVILGLEGPEGECHGGLTRPSCSRVLNLYPKDTTIRNTRQLSVVSQEELDSIAGAIGVESLAPEWLGASMVVQGISDFSHVPPSSRLLFPSGAAICVDLENRPCVFPGREIEKDHPGLGPKFKPAAKNRRGIAAWVECAGQIALGDSIKMFVPDQPAWTGTNGA